MHVREALAQLDVIHEHLSRAGTYRGFRCGAVALTGVLGLVAAILQPWFVAGDETAFVRYWVVTAGVCALPSAGTSVFLRLFHEEGLARKRTDGVAGQFLPCVVAGAVVTYALAEQGRATLLPGLWAVLFGLGNLAMRPYLPRAIVIVGVFYLLAGSGLLMTTTESTPPGWTVGGVFGIGHFLSALVLLLDRNRGGHV